MITVHRIEFDVKGYATRKNAIAAVEKLFAATPHRTSADVSYIISVNEAGRFYPVFIGEKAIEHSMYHYFPTCS